MRATIGPPRSSVLLLAAVLLPAIGVGQGTEPITAARVRALTKDAQAAGRNDSNAIVLDFDKRVRARWGDFESFPISIVRREDITLYLATPLMSYRRLLIEHLRMREPLGSVPWLDAAVVSVGPNSLTAPDVAEVIVERNGTRVPPLKNTLRPMQFTSGAGETASIHGGEVHFPMSAFAPGATVTVTAVAGPAGSFVLTLEDAQLRQLK